MYVRPFNRDRTKVMISVGFLAVFSLMLLVTYLSVSTLTRVNTSMADLIHNTEQKTTLAYQMRDMIRVRSYEVRAMAQTLDWQERENLFDQLTSTTRTYNQARLSLTTLGANEPEKEILNRIAEADHRAQDAYGKASNRIYAMVHDPEALKAAISSVQLSELVLLNHLNRLVQLEKELAKEALVENQLRYSETRSWLIASVSLAFVVSILISAAVISRVSAANRRIKHLANHDDLTGIHNRRSFEDTLAHIIKTYGRTRQNVGVLYLDFDRFKIVNDTCGHHAGDQLLIQISTLILSCLGPDDVFARVGGDEFAIIARGDSIDDILALAEKIRESVEQFQFTYLSQTFSISASIGVIEVTGEENDLETLLQDVDSACYVAKQWGRNRVHLADPSDDEVVKYRNDIAGMHHIRHALDTDLLQLYYQPVHEILEQGTAMVHCEILLRIINENGDIFSPAEFIPIAEKYNLMAEIDRWVISNVMQWVATYQVDHEIPRLLINLSGLSFVDEDFLEFVVAELESNDIDPTRIAFEITETAAVDNIAQANVFIEKLRAIGCRFALDDFGTGFSTFEYLKAMPVDYLKIDGSLVKNITTDSVNREMVRAINDIGHTVGAKTIAEFVEDEATVQILRDMGVNYAQGYGLRRPEPLERLVGQLPGSEGHMSEWREAS